VAKTTFDGGRGPARFARALASPVGVIITVPLIVVACGLGILLLGRGATRTATETMARHQLAQQATATQNDVAFALDQADPLLARLASFADESRPIDDVLVRMQDLLVGRPGVSYVSVSFPTGTFRGAYVTAAGGLEVQESRITPSGTDVNRFTVVNGTLAPRLHEMMAYDPRTRPFYTLAVTTARRAWTDPYTFFQTHATGITCSEPVFGPDHALVAVLTVDFDVTSLSGSVVRSALDHARSLVFAGDGTILASPASDQYVLPSSNKLMHHEDLHDPAVESLFAMIGAHGPKEQEFLTLSASDGDYLASVAPIGGKRAGVSVPLDWYVATVVPTSTLLGPTRALERSSVIASAGALAVAVGIALVLAWNLVRMRKQVAASKQRATVAEARVVEMGSYRLVAKLGAGGMGEVWRAQHQLLARQAAIKLIRPEVMHDAQYAAEIRERFRREAQTLASMKSRHTIQIFDYGVTAEGVFYYVMELLDGLDLESLVVRYGPQPAARVIPFLADAASSLAEAHRAGMLHRDIKPPNLFLCRAADELDIAKLLDFGIVQTLSEPQGTVRHAYVGPIPSVSSLETPKLTQLGAMLGTPGFMAPEQILGMQLDGRADLYSLGCVAWWLLTGREVFSRDVGDAKLLHRHIYEPLPQLRPQVMGWLPVELESLIVSCLAKEADGRPHDAQMLADQLRAIPIPEVHAWTAARSVGWWQGYTAPAPIPSVSPSEQQVIMPGRTIDHRPPIASDERAMAQTIVPHRRG